MQDWSRIQNSSSITQNDKDKLNASLDPLRTIGVVAGPISTAAGAIVLFLNFKVGNRNADIAHRNAEIAESRLITERFSKAVEQLGSDTLEVCLGGIYSLEKIATDSNSSSYYNEIIMELLTAFIRETSNLIYKNTIDENKNVTDENKKNIRSSVAIQIALNVVERLNSSQTLSSNSLDLSFAKLGKFKLEGNFSRFNFTGATLKLTTAYKVDFKNSLFRIAKLNYVYMMHSYFQATDFESANLSESNFENANFQDSNFMYANLSQSNFENANFQGANLKGANLRQSNFENANFQNADLEGADLQLADLRGADLNQSNLEGVLYTAFELIKAAKNYEKARYDDDLRQRLNIPEN